MKGIIYYTAHKVDRLKEDWMLKHLVIDSVKASNLPVVSVSQRPMDFGTNIVLHVKPCAVSMFKQILVGLLASEADHVFFCEDDVIYHPSHFDFEPTRDDTFYYNVNVWRCHPRRNIAVTYDEMRSLSGMCVNRELAVEHFIKRLAYIHEKGYHKDPSKNPKWAREMGYEPGKRGYWDERKEEWKSEFPNLDIRHRLTSTIPKLHKSQFNVPPKNWVETTVDNVPGWDIKKLWGLD